MLIVEIRLYIQFLYLLLENGVSDSSAINLLKIEALRVIVIERNIYKSIEAGRDELIPFRVCMEYRSFRIRDSWLMHLAIDVSEVCRGSVAGESHSTFGTTRISASPTLKF